MEEKITVSIIEDNLTIRGNIEKYISKIDDIEIAGAAGSVESFFHMLEVSKSFESDILLLDIGLPGMSGIDAISLIKEKLPNTDIIMLTTFEEEKVVLKSICAGAVAYLSKRTSLAQICETVRLVSNGGSYMSPNIAREIMQHIMGGPSKPKKTSDLITDRQLEILRLLVDGKEYKEIAKELFVSPETVRTHIKKLYKNLNVNNKAQAVAKYLKGDY